MKFMRKYAKIKHQKKVGLKNYMAKFVHHDLALLNPSFDSPLIDTLTELEYLRRLQLAGSTPPYLFFQLKRIFHIFESLGSARIEGNHTTLADYVEHIVSAEEGAPSDQLREIENIERAMDYIDEGLKPGDQITEHFIRELHALAVKSLEREGDRTPGAYRSGRVVIAQSNHLPPDAAAVPGYMKELVQFINQDDAQKYDLMKVAIAHHRFGWIHPFSNGNGRVVRLLTYALLLKYGFNVAAGNRLLNPTAVFCTDREKYYEMLGDADAGTPEALERWCTYVLSGVLTEMKKVDQLLDYKYLRQKVLQPAISFAQERQHVTKQESAVLLASLQTADATVRSADLAPYMPGLSSQQRTYQIRKLVERQMLIPLSEGARSYYAGFANSYLLRGVMKTLSDEGFISSGIDTRP